jgi:hypothetical protein
MSIGMIQQLKSAPPIQVSDNREIIQLLKQINENLKQVLAGVKNKTITIKCDDTDRKRIDDFLANNKEKIAEIMSSVHKEGAR